MKYEMHVISNTHWDREWRYSFQETRMLLIDMMDWLLDLLDREPNYKYFHLDGQTALLEDYLEIRPNKKERLKKYIKEGRILVGPWYTLPDEFLVSGESLIRNLMRGDRVAEEFGQIMKVGYTPTGHGQISQIAQIYRGFQIGTILFYRGITPDECESEYILEAPDGTRILGIRFSPALCRANFWVLLYQPTIHNQLPFKFKWEEGGLPFHLCDTDSYQSDYWLLDSGYLETFNEKQIPDNFKMAKDDVTKGATTPYLLLMDGMDSNYPHPNTIKIIEVINKLQTNDRMIHSSLPEFIEKVKSSVDMDKLTTLKGERRTPNKEGIMDKLLKDPLSARLHLKRINHRIQLAIEKWAEPFASWAWTLGSEYPQSLLELAWRYLLLNHAHDSIGGVSVDQVHDDMSYRFAQAELISNNVTKRSLAHIVTLIDNADADPEDILLVTFNPLPFERTEVIEAYVDFPKETRAEAFSMYDADGGEIVYQILSKEGTYTPVKNPFEVPFPYHSIRYKISFLADSVLSMGYKTFRIKPKPATKRNLGNLITDTNMMENEFLRIQINANGTLKITDKETGKVYDNCNFFEDSGEVGTPHIRVAPMSDKVITSIGAKANVSVEEDNALQARFKIEVKLSLPESITDDKKRRSNQEKEYIISSVVSLSKGIRRVDITTRVNNNVRDHRLRVMFPSGIDTDFSHAEGHFDVLKRRIKLPDTSDWVEPMTGTNPQLSWVDVSDGTRGLAILNQGLPEFEILGNKDRTIAITLLRCCRHAKLGGEQIGGAETKDRTDQIGSQCLGEHEFRYAIYPHEGNWESARVYREAYQYNVPMKIAQCGRHKGKLSKELSFFKLEPKNLILSAVKKSEERDSLIVRVFNPTEKSMKGKISFYKPIKKARTVNLNEEPVEDKSASQLFIKDDSISFEIEKKRIISVEVFF